MVNSSFPADVGSSSRSESINSLACTCDELFQEVWSKGALIQDIMQGERDKFLLWAFNIGVFAEQQLSLDFRLRDMDDITGSIKAQLDIISGHLMRLTQVPASQLEELHDTENSARKRLKTGSYDGEPEPGQVSAADTMEAAVGDIALKRDRVMADIKSSRLSIGRSLSWLQRLSNLIRSASFASQDRRAERFKFEDINLSTDGFRSYFERVVKTEFAGLSNKLLKRLIESMLIRRRRFEYRQRQERRWDLKVLQLKSHAHEHSKPSEFNAEERVVAITYDAPIQQIPNTLEEISNAPTSVVSTPTIDVGRLRNLQQKSTIGSGRSAPLGNRSKMRIPKAPKQGLAGLDFTCQYCWLVLPSHVARPEEWANHIKLDLHPYICLVEECTAPVELFATKKEWLSHMRKRHFTQWSCNISSHKVSVHLQSEDDFIKHMKTAHPKRFRDEILPLIARRSSHTRNRIFETCPFCDVVGNELEAHVAEHLRELALLSWPSTDLGEDGDVSCNPLESDEGISDVALRSENDDTGGSELSLDDSFNKNDENWGIPDSALLEYEFLGQHWGLVDLDVAGRSSQSIAVRLEQSEEMKYLEESIDRARQAVQLTPFDDPDLPGHLNNLGGWLKTRFERSGEIKDLEEAIERARRAVQLTPPDHLDLPGYLNNLSVCLKKRFERSGETEDLEEALDIGRRAVHVTKKFISLDSSELYTIGWIAVLPVELAATLAMLEERHDEPSDFEKPPSDYNYYHWGRIGDHNIVIASLPAGVHATISAANIAVHMLSSFPNIKVGLMVGIGAGIARPNQRRDIRLGDVVVSLSRETSGGVIQYDLRESRASEDQGHITHTFERVGFLNSPPEVLLKALTTLRAQVRLEGSKVSSYLEEMLERYPQMVESEPDQPGYTFQGQDNDKLFEASYIHASGVGCDDCDSTRTVPRDTRPDPQVPRVHYGVIASGNKVIEDASMRDLIREKLGEDCICLETEAAGLMESFPCLVIRGICDYADTHKNDGWQKYAAATAAAYAKEFLGLVDNQALPKTNRAIDILHDLTTLAVSGDISKIATGVNDTGETVQEMRSDSHGTHIRGWLSAADPSVNYTNALEKRHPGTGAWFIASQAFAAWKQQSKSFLWLHGDPGCGKTVLSSTIIEHLSKVTAPHQVLLYFYFDFNHQNKTTLENMVCSLITQLYQGQPATREHLDYLWRFVSEGHLGLSKQLLEDILLTMLSEVKDVSIILDALDESSTKPDLLAWLRGVLETQSIACRILVTARRQADIESVLQSWMRPEDSINIHHGGIEGDIRAYIHHMVHNSEELIRWQEMPDVQDEVELSLVEKARGTFRWVARQFDVLKNCLDYPRLRQALNDFPETLA